MKLLVRYLRPYGRRMLLGLAIKISGTIAELMLPFILSHVRRVVVARQDLYVILRWGGAMVVCAILAVMMNVTANRLCV